MKVLPRANRGSRHKEMDFMTMQLLEELGARRHVQLIAAPADEAR
jgi:hypothetical protein